MDGCRETYVDLAVKGGFSCIGKKDRNEKGDMIKKLIS